MLPPPPWDLRRTLARWRRAVRGRAAVSAESGSFCARAFRYLPNLSRFLLERAGLFPRLGVGARCLGFAVVFACRSYGGLLEPTINSSAGQREEAIFAFSLASVLGQIVGESENVTSFGADSNYMSHVIPLQIFSLQRSISHRYIYI